MKISILGSNGFLSNAISAFAYGEGWQVDVFGLAEPLVKNYTSFCKVDLTATSFDCSILRDSDIIVYAIGAGIQSNLKEGADLIYNLNVTAPVAICNQLKALDYKGVFVTFGSVFEMGETSECRSFTEDDVLKSPCRAPSEYVVSKRMLSRFVSSYNHDFKHWHFIIPTIYGEGENPKRLIPYVVNALKSGDELHFTSGEQTRQYVYVGEVASMLGFALDRELPSGVYNIEGCDTVTVKEIVNRIATAIGKTVSENCFGSANRTDVGMKYLALDGSKLEAAIGFKSKVHIEDVIERY